MASARTNRRLAGAGALLLVALTAGALWTLSRRSGPGPAAPPPASVPRNLLLVTVDTTRADRLGCYGYEEAATPVLDRLARDGVLFEHCISPAPITLPSHATLLTGLQPYSHGARNNGTHHVPPEVDTLAEQLRRAGFATGAVVSAFVLDARFGLDQGFDHYDDDLSAGTGTSASGYRETQAEDSVRRAQAWLAQHLAQHGDERWFLWLHLFDPHADYAAPEPFTAGGYDGEIAYVDAMVGELLSWLGARAELDETLVVVTADHGESLGEHGEATHGIFVYDATTRVPLILSHASLARGSRIAQVVASADVVPTALDLLGAGLPDGLDGRSLAAAARGAQLDALAAYSESKLPFYNYGWSDLLALRSESHRYVRAPRSELYSLAADPGETRDRAGEAPETLASFSQRLDRRLATRDVDARLWTVEQIAPDVRASLAGLGYVFDEQADESARERPDPKDRVRAIEQQQEAEGLRLAGRLSEAQASYRALLDANPGAVPIRDALASVLVELGRLEEARELHRGSLGLPGAGVGNLLDLAELERRLGVEGWERSLALAKQLDPRDPRPWVREGDHVHLPGDPAAALAAYRRALQLDEACAPAWLGVCRIEMGRRDAVAAAEAARRATEADPALFEAWYQLGAMSAAAGQFEEARRCFARARELEPDHVAARIRLALVLGLLGDDEQALVELRHAVQLDRGEVERTAAGTPKLAELLRRLP